MSITEVSHRSAVFEEVLNDAIARIKRLLKVPDNYKILFLQGGASTQFCMVPMNLDFAPALRLIMSIRDLGPRRL